MSNITNIMNITRDPRDHGLASIEMPGGERLVLVSLLGIGRNYAEHAGEQGAAVPDRPMVFSKHPGSVALDGEAIVIPAACRDPGTGGPAQVDFEAELAVIIGTSVKDATVGDALGCVLGYTAANDVSARWWQKHGSNGQFTRGKSFDTFCPLGPVVVPAADVPDPQALAVRCRVNGVPMQDGTTADMIFPVATLISELSRGTTLLAGTVLLTGTPSGVGMARTPPVWLAEGDVVEVEIGASGDRHGPLLVVRNPVTHG